MKARSGDHPTKHHILGLSYLHQKSQDPFNISDGNERKLR